MKHKENLRMIDDLGRIVIPIEYRNSLGILSGDMMRIELDGEKITIRKNNEACIFCDSESGLTKYEGKTICLNCIRKISKMPN